MKLNFTKMHGIGNDYIYINCFENHIDDPSRLAVKLSDRHFSIGGDGIILICPSSVADVRMIMFNNDGSEGRMCGNGIRCVGKYAYDNLNIKKDVISVETKSGIKKLQVFTDNGKAVCLSVDMGPAIFKPADIPVKLEGSEIISRPVMIGTQSYKITAVSMGNPHCIVFTDDVKQIKLEEVGTLFENNEIFPEKVNTEFIHVIDRTHIQMRVWERGTGETYACGTGACAAVAACVKNNLTDSNVPVHVQLPGGILDITYSDETVIMTGPAETAFEGTVEI